MQKLNSKASDNFVAPHKVGRNQFGPWVSWRKSSDPDIFHIGLPWVADSKPGESPEQRAFRRFPIDSHKPGGW